MKKEADGMGDLGSPEGSPQGSPEGSPQGSPEGSLGSGTGWLNPGLPRRRLGIGTRRGLSTPAPWTRSYRSMGTRDSGIGTIGTLGLKCVADMRGRITNNSSVWLDHLLTGHSSFIHIYILSTQLDTNFTIAGLRTPAPDSKSFQRHLFIQIICPT